MARLFSLPSQLHLNCMFESALSRHTQGLKKDFCPTQQSLKLLSQRRVFCWAGSRGQMTFLPPQFFNLVNLHKLQTCWSKCLIIMLIQNITSILKQDVPSSASVAYSFLSGAYQEFLSFMSVVAKQESLAVFYCNKWNRFSVKHDGVAKLQQLQLQPTLWQTRMSCIWQRGRMHAVCHKYWLSVSNDRKLLIKKCYFSNRFSPIMSVHACITGTQTSLTLENIAPLQISTAPSVIAPYCRPWTWWSYIKAVA